MKNFLLVFLLISNATLAQQISKVWVANQGNGTYKNPILNADYSDPDAIRVGDDYYLTSSSFNHIPGLPILHSKDLVNWTIIGHALLKQPPFDVFNKVQHGNGVWAPAIRFHNGEFYIYYPDPDYGIYLVKAKNPAGPWSNPILVYAGKGIIDPCPLWDEDGKTWLVHAYAGSRAGIKSVIALAPMNVEGTKVIGESHIIYDGHETDPTIEGPKIYKRNHFYYIFAPAGGVPTGWQLVLRSKNINGPYQRKVVMDQGKTTVNGPHQGAWVSTQTGEDWFFHFQDKDAYGRVVHLEPMKWVKDWPVIGLDKDGDGKGEPVYVYKKPNAGKNYPTQTPAESDEFDGKNLGLQWQWQANSNGNWFFLQNGNLRLYSQLNPDSVNSLWNAPNLLMQKLPADRFQATTKLTFTPNEKLLAERAGLIIFGYNYSTLYIQKQKDGLYLMQGVGLDAVKGKAEQENIITKLSSNTIFLRLKVNDGARVTWAYSLDGKVFINVKGDFKALPGKWVGATMGIYAIRSKENNDAGYADFDWFRVEPLTD